MWFFPPERAQRLRQWPVLLRKELLLLSEAEPPEWRPSTSTPLPFLWWHHPGPRGPLMGERARGQRTKKCQICSCFALHWKEGYLPALKGPVHPNYSYLWWSHEDIFGCIVPRDLCLQNSFCHPHTVEMNEISFVELKTSASLSRNSDCASLDNQHNSPPAASTVKIIHSEVWHRFLKDTTTI